MEFVEPIRDPKKIEAMKKYLGGQSTRDLLLFVLGINTNLRISDILKLKLEDVTDNKKKPLERIELREKKTGKVRLIALPPNVKKVLEKYLAETELESDSYLIKSREGENQAITRQQAYRIINAAARGVGIKDRIGTHTLRKTFGYHAYKAGYSLALLQDLFNHSSERETLRYIGITQDEKDQVYINLNL